jgi:uncharacterized membrane protein
MDPSTFTDDEIEKGKTLALLCYLGVFMGFPLAFIPIVQRENRFAFYHARHALVVWVSSLILTVVLLFLTFLTCGMAAPLFFLVVLNLIPTIDGLIKASGGKAEPPLIVGGITESLLSGVTMDAPEPVEGPVGGDAPAGPAQSGASEP